MPLLQANRIRINLLEQPFGIRRGRLFFSWRVGSDQRMPALRQGGYRITIAAGLKNAADGVFVYDSGWVDSHRSHAVSPEGLDKTSLHSDQMYYATVTLRDEDGCEGPPSPPLPFTIDTNWVSIEGIWNAREEDGTPSDFLFARHAFFLDENDMESLDRLLVSVTATSPEPSRQYVYTLFCNGETVGVGPVRYGRDPHGDPLLYTQTYDITPLCHVGENVLAALNYALSDRAFLCQMTLFFRDGTSRVLTNSGRDTAHWQVMPGDQAFGKDNSIGTHYFKAHACNINAHFFPFGFHTEDGSAVGPWTSPVRTGVIGGGMPLLPAECEPVHRHLSPASATVTRRTDGDILIDLGKEIVGGLRITFDASSDTTVTLTYGEQRIPDETGEMTVKFPMNTGNRYCETWTLTPGRQTAESFGLMTFRYVRLSGYEKDLSPSDVRGVEIRKAFDEKAGALSTDHPLLAALYRLTSHTVKVTTQDIYVDSQSRERGAYEGDLLINLLAAYATEDCFAPARLTAEYLLGHRTWPADYLLCIIFAARADYMATGDDRLLSAWYATLKNNLFTDCMGACGLIRSPEVGESNRNAVLVDWPPSERDGYDMNAPYNTVLNALQVRAYDDMAYIAGILDHAEDAAAFAALRDGLRTAMIEHLYDPADGLFADGCSEAGSPVPHKSQHATAYALHAGIYTDAAMADRMAEAMCDGGKLRVSVYAAFFLLEGLYRVGRGDLANRLLLDEDIADGARTWAYMCDRMHATVTTEAWNERNKPNMTLSHPWGAAPAHMMAFGIFGVRPTSPAYETFDVRPAPYGIGRASMTVPTLSGPIRVAFDTTGDACILTLDVPPNTTATVYPPDGNGLFHTVEAGSWHITANEAVHIHQDR